MMIIRRKEEHMGYYLNFPRKLDMLSTYISEYFKVDFMTTESRTASIFL